VEGAVKVFVDTAPVMEKPLAQAAGLGWQGKHTNLVSRDLGSWFFLAEIFTDLPLPVDAPETDHLRFLPGLPRCLSDAGFPGCLPPRCAPLHFLSDDRAQGPDSGRVPRGDGKPDLWLRRLSCRLSLEQIRASRAGGEAAGA
jgi:hypothetical protein